MRIERVGPRGWAALGLVMLLAGCPERQPPVEVVNKGTALDGGAQAVSPEGIVTFDGYQAARAQPGDTVGDVAGRIGLSAAELGAYNGLAPTSPLRGGDLLVLPPRPDGSLYGAAPAPFSAAPVPAPAPVPAIEAQPLGADPDPPGAETGPDLAAAPAESPLPSASGWSPELALEAIERSSDEPETETPGTRGALAEPPSAGSPLPAEPGPVEVLESPGLSQYQTARRPEGTVSPPLPESPIVTPSAPATRLARPVDGPVALAFGEGDGRIRNEGVDFDAPAGAPVFAAEDGTVALVSESLGALGTIVLIRHDGELLTSYGRITGVSVSKGQRVVRGQQIGVVFDPGGGAPPRMHFEVRRGSAPLNPEDFI